VRERVQAAAVSLGYTANPHARSLAGAVTTTIGLLVHDISDPYYAEVAAGVMRAADAGELLVLTVATQWDPERVVSAISTLRAQRVQAIVLGGSGFDDDAYRSALRKHVRELRGEGIGVACVSDHGVLMDMVLPDNHGGAGALARALLELGHRRFGVIGGRADVLTLRDRVEGFRGSLAEAGVELGDGDVAWGGSSREEAYQAASTLLERRVPPTALFAVTDMMAVAALSAVLDHGILVPHGVSVAGFTDVKPLRDVRPALTTVHLPLREIGRVAVELALSPQQRRQTRRVAAEVVLRTSTGPPSRQ
jgi:LacI family transcriptional regulator